MAALVQTLQIAGFPSVANGGNPATGTGLLGSSSVEYWSDGSMIVTTPTGKRIRVEDDPQMNNLWSQILRGVNGLATSKQLNIAS